MRWYDVRTSTLVHTMLGLRAPIDREDNSPAARIGPMELGEARRRIRDHANLHAFISLSAETGSGAVVAVKDLVDVAGMVTTAGGILPPENPARDDTPGSKP